MIALLLWTALLQAEHRASTDPQQQSLHAAEEAFKAGSAAAAQHDLAVAHREFAKVVRLAPKVAAGHTAFGAVLMEEGDTDAAVAQLELARRLDPADNSAALNLATGYFRRREYSKSLELFRTVEGRPEGVSLMTPDAWADYARSLVATGSESEAIEKLKAGLASADDSALLHDALGAALANQHRLREAQPEFERAITLDANYALAHLHLGALYLLLERPHDAVDECTKAVALAPNDSEANLQLGRALNATGDFEHAAPALRRAVELNRDSADAKYALGLTLQNQGMFEEAVLLFEQTVAAQPQNAAALTNLGLALVQSGKAKEAIPFYERALKIDRNPVLLEDLGVAYLQQSDLDHAIEQFRGALELSPDNAELHYDLGLALKLKDRVQDAISELSQSERLNPNLADPPYTLGVLYMQVGRFDDAVRELSRATTLRPDYGPAWSTLGTVYKQMDDPDKAVTALQRAIELLPQQPGPHLTLASVFSQQGKTAEAALERKLAADLSRVAVSRQRATFALDNGNLLLKRGQIAEAVAQFQTAISADPAFAPSHRALADALTRQGKAAEAALERQKAQDLERHP